MLCVTFILIAIINCGAREIQSASDAEEFSLNVVSIESLTPPVVGSRIIGGSATSIKNFPYTVQILYNRQLYCGGSLLTTRHVLSAGHCYVNSNTGVPHGPSFFSIRAGATNLNEGGTVHSVSTIIVHQGYNYITHDNDVAVMVLGSSLQISDSVQKALIPFQGETLVDNSTVVAVGWGWTSILVPGVSNVLNEVSVRTVNRVICRERYAWFANRTGSYLPVTDNMICAGLLDIGGADACQGDSGGPLVYNGVIVGITSWGVSCADPRFPGVYAKVSRYTTWINQTVTRYNGSARSQAGIIAVLVPLIFVMLSV